MMGLGFDILNEKNTACHMVCWWYDGIREKTLWYGMLAVWYDGTVSWTYFIPKFARWHGMFQYIRSVRVEYVLQILTT